MIPFLINNFDILFVLDWFKCTWSFPEDVIGIHLQYFNLIWGIMHSFTFTVPTIKWIKSNAIVQSIFTRPIMVQLILARPLWAIAVDYKDLSVHESVFLLWHLSRKRLLWQSPLTVSHWILTFSCSVKITRNHREKEEIILGAFWEQCNKLNCLRCK